MKVTYCVIILVTTLAACRGRDRSPALATPGADTTSTAAAGSIGRPVVPEPTPAPNVATGAAKQRPTSSAPAHAEPAIARIAGASAVLRSKGRRTASAADTGGADTGTAGAKSGAAAGSVKVNQFMSYDKANKRVDMQVFAAFDHSLGGFNFNGGFSGNDTITVPQGWTVNMKVVNKDAIPHSAIIIAAQTPLPAMPDKPALPAAYTTHLTDGLAPGGGSDTMRFKASKAGSYFLACGVPGHAASGMYVVFNVSASAAAPTYKR